MDDLGEEKRILLSENSLTVLKKRYLAKNEKGEYMETPEELFRRVARNISIIDILYIPEVYNFATSDEVKLDKSGFEICKEASLSFEEPTDDLLDYTPNDLKMLKRAYDELASMGCMRVGFDEVLELLKKNFASIKGIEDEFYDAMVHLEFLPNSPALMNAGRDLQQLSACFVLPIEDSMASIFDSLKHAALIHQSGGGTGFSFSRLRPKNDVVRSTGGVASGPVSFMKVFNSATEAVKQGGTRRGANMGILRVDHPDILEFVSCKSDNKDITNFNISVALTDKFMEALERAEKYDLINPRNGEVTGALSATEVFDLIVDHAWKNGEPGIVFIDQINRGNPTPLQGEIESTNPCGEQPLLPHEACCLGSINLERFVENDEICWQELGRAVRCAIHFLDNLIDANKHPLVEIEEMVHRNRKIGLGVMGWADALIRLRIPYDSEEAVDLGRRVMEFINSESKAASAELAQVRGVFPGFKDSIYDREPRLLLRNATTTTIAPTGTISIIAGASGGIEPLFSIVFTRNVLDNQQLIEVNPLFEEIARAEGFYSEDLMMDIAAEGSIANIAGIPEWVKRVFVTAHDISPEWHVKMQAAFQGETDNAVSKTVNFPNEATHEDVAKVYLLAYSLGCKGVTVYRDGSRESQVLTVGKATASAVNNGVNGAWGKIKPIDRPTRLQGFTDVKETPLGKLFLTLNVLNSHPIELFAQIGKAGSDVSAFTEGIARLISLALRCGVAPEEVVDQLVGIGGSRSVGFGPNRVRSVPDAIGQFINEYLDRHGEIAGIRNDLAATISPLPEVVGKNFNICPSCGLYTFARIEGCSKCFACGFSEC